MKNLFKTFREWMADKNPELGYENISEVGTSTGDCASFKQPVIGGPGPLKSRRKPWEILYKSEKDEQNK